MKNKKIILGIIFGLFLCNLIEAQTKVQYSYDKVGNRVKRKLYVCPSCPGNQQTGRMASAEKDTTETIVAQHGLSLFPNPTQDKVNLTLSNLKDDEPTSVMVTDETGKILYSAKNLQSENEINMAGFNNGTYFVRVTMGKDLKVYKVMKLQ